MGKVISEHIYRDAKLAQSEHKPPVIAFSYICNDASNDGVYQYSKRLSLAFIMRLR
jgi:hypothetical protein